MDYVNIQTNRLSYSTSADFKARGTDGLLQGVRSMAIANKHHSSMRVAVVSASRAQRESLKSLIEDNGPKVVTVTTMTDYLARPESVKSDVLLIDLAQATDFELEHVSDLVASAKIPVLLNESPNIPTMPGPYRDDWANNLIGKLVDLAEQGGAPKARGILDRPRYVQNSSYRLPKVMILSRSKTRRRVLELILINQGFQETHEANYDKKYALTRPGAVDIFVLDEHNLGPDEKPAFDAIVAQTNVPVTQCNSSQIPTDAGERRQWGQKFAAQLIQLHKKQHPISDALRSRSDDNLSAVWAQETSSDAIDHAAAQSDWGDRMAAKLARIRMSIKSNRDDFMAETRTHTFGKSSSEVATIEEQPERAKIVPITEQVSASIAEAKRESAELQQRIAKELERDLKYLRPETAAALRKVKDNELHAQTDTAGHEIPNEKAKTLTPTTTELELVDASNLENLPRTPHPGEHPAAARSSASADQQAAEIARVFDLNDQMNRADEALINKAKKDAAEFSFSKLEIVDDGGNPFVRKPSGAKKLSPKAPAAKKVSKAYRSKSPLARIINTIHDIQKKMPKIFN